MDKHTPGPWSSSIIPFELRATDSVSSIWGPYKESGSPLIADISRSPGDEEAQANAHLIAACPDMIKALQEFVKWAEDQAMWDKTGSAYYMAVEAIKKAINK